MHLLDCSSRSNLAFWQRKSTSMLNSSDFWVALHYIPVRSTTIYYIKYCSGEIVGFFFQIALDGCLLWSENRFEKPSHSMLQCDYSVKRTKSRICNMYVCMEYVNQVIDMQSIENVCNFRHIYSHSSEKRGLSSTF